MAYRYTVTLPAGWIQFTKTELHEIMNWGEIAFEEHGGDPKYSNAYQKLKKQVEIMEND